MNGLARATAGGVAVLCGTTTVGLGLLAVVGDLTLADTVASVVGAVVCLSGAITCVSVLRQTSSPPTEGAVPDNARTAPDDHGTPR